MNEIAKTQTQTKLVKAMEHEGLRPSEAAAIIGIMPNYISMIKNPNQWDKCPSKAWDAVLLWVNSGQSLKEYSEKHGKVLPPEKPHIELPPKVISVKQPEINKPLIKDKPEALAKRKKELAERENTRPSKGQLIDMLIAEKELLKIKIDAIDVLLKHYIS